MKEKVLVIGGSRFVGPVLVEKLCALGAKVSVCNRGIRKVKYPKGVIYYQGDRAHGFGNIKEAFDVVIDMCAYEGADTERALNELSFGFFIHISTVAVYEKTGVFPITEEFPLGPWPLWGAYNQGKVECERVLLQSGRSYASVRPTYILGANNYVPREEWIYRRLREDKKIILPGDGEARVQFVFKDEVAEIMARLAETKKEGVWNAAGDTIVSMRGLVRLMADISGTIPVIRTVEEIGRPASDVDEFPFANESILVSNDRAKSLGIHFFPLRKGLERDYQEFYSKGDD